MKTRREVFDDIEELRHLIEDKFSYVVSKEASDILMANVKKMTDYADENDKWGEPCWGTDECVVYVSIFVLMHCALVGVLNTVDDPEKFYNFIEAWFREHAEHYRKRVELGTLKETVVGNVMAYDCAKEVIEVIKNSKDE